MVACYRRRMEFRSPDGTVLSADVSGSGPPLVLVHGIAGDAQRWGSSRRLATSFTLHALDRRGRGKSGDGTSYALEREVEDLVALCEAIDGEVYLLGHSFGGLLALEAAGRVTRVTKLLVYEPYAPEVPVAEPSPTTRSFFAALPDRETVLVRFLREVVLMSEAEVTTFRTTPWWARRLAAAPTIPREMAGVETHRARLDALVARGIPVRFLLGAQSPAFLREATERFQRALPGSVLHELAGQGHIAMDMAPELFEREVRDFFLGT